MTPEIVRALRRGWTVESLTAELLLRLPADAGPALLSYRLKDLPPAPKAAKAEPDRRSWPKWCGVCDGPTTRRPLPSDGGELDRTAKCPDCHPDAGALALHVAV